MLKTADTSAEYLPTTFGIHVSEIDVLELTGLGLIPREVERP